MGRDNHISDKNTNKILFKYVYNLSYNEKAKIIEKEYNKCHFGIKSVFQSVQNKYYGITKKDVEMFIKTCKICKVNKQTIIKKSITPIIEICNRDRYMMDLVDFKQFSEYNNDKKYLFTCVDSHSKFGWNFPIENKTSDCVLRCLRQIFKNFGPPIILHSDNGKEFKNLRVKNLCLEYNIQHVFGKPYKPTTQGQVERFNRTIKHALLKRMVFEDRKDWSVFYDEIIYEYNKKIHRATSKSPFQIFLGTSGYNPVTKINHLSSDNQKK